MRKGRLLALAAVAVAALSCGLEEVGEGSHSNPEGIWTGQLPGPPGSEYCFVSVLEYPEGHDWRADPEPEEGRCSLAVYADCIPVKKIPAGKGTEIPLDPERHRLISGHVYTDFSDGKTTVIRYDGKELLRWEGEDLVTDMIVSGDSLHTLSVPVDGEGFRYRVNGRPVIQRDAGRCFGHMRSFRDTVAFCFCQPSRSSSALSEDFYVSANGKVSKVNLPSSVVKVWDMMVHEGETCIIVSENGVLKGPMMLQGSRKWQINYMLYTDVASCRFTDTEALCAEVVCIHQDKRLTGLLCKAEMSWTLCEVGRTLSAYQVNDAGYYYVSNSTADSHNGKIFRNHMMYGIPGDYAVMGINPVAVKDGDMYIGFSSRTGGFPAVWKNGSLTSLKVNGYIARVSYGKL